MGKMTARGWQAITAPGMHSDGDGLYLCVKPSGARSWVFRSTLAGRRVEFGLGGASVLTLAEAREKAHEFKCLVKSGKDPRHHYGRRAPDFETMARAALDHLRPSWKSEAHAARWWSSLEIHVLPHIGRHKIAKITPAELQDILAPIWTTKADTARRVAYRINFVIDFAQGRGFGSGPNPMQLARKGLKPGRPAVQHRPSMPYQAAPEFFARLERQEGTAAIAHLFLILTAGRAGEVLGARWSEIHGDTWIIPAERMKMQRPHRVPLSKAAQDVLEQVRGLDRDLCFPSPASAQRARQMTSNAFSALRTRMGVEGITTHGFRSTFRTWSGEVARAKTEVAELCLAHASGKPIVRAYQRSDLLAQRRELMNAWARHLCSKRGNVVALSG